jgi:hypothetical protein
MIEDREYVVGLDNTLYGLKLAQKGRGRDNEFHRWALERRRFKWQFKMSVEGLGWFRSFFAQK